MIEYTTRDFLKSVGDELTANARSTLVESAQKRSPTASTFLSHSTKDTDQLPAVIKILSNHGASVYIDKKDEQLPPYTNRNTAKILRSRIDVCKKFVLLASTNSKESKWMPWELGLADGYKTSNNVAIFPSTESRYDGSWSEREYLGVYDRIVWGDLEGYKDAVWIVWNQDKNTGLELSRWLNQ